MTNKVSNCSSPDKNVKSGNMESSKMKGGMQSAKGQQSTKGQQSAAESSNMKGAAAKNASQAECGNMKNSANSRSAKGSQSAAESSNMKGAAAKNSSRAECGNMKNKSNMESSEMSRAASGAANSSSKASYKGVSGAESAEAKRYKCSNCGTVVRSANPPSKCPKCDSTEFGD